LKTSETAAPQPDKPDIEVPSFDKLSVDAQIVREADDSSFWRLISVEESGARKWIQKSANDLVNASQEDFAKLMGFYIGISFAVFSFLTFLFNKWILGVMVSGLIISIHLIPESFVEPFKKVWHHCGFLPF
jgi:hypothetical protein